MKAFIDDNGLRRIAAIFRNAQALQIEENDLSDQVVLTRVGAGDSNYPAGVGYFSNGVVLVQLPTGGSRWFDATNPSGGGSFRGEDSEDRIDAAIEAFSSWDYANNEPLNEEDNKWISLAGGQVSSDVYGVPSGVRM